MTRIEKQELLDALSAEFKEATAIAVCDYKGLSVAELEGVRNTARKASIKVKVIKNTLAGIALQKADKAGLELKDTNIFLWSEDQVELSKALVKFQKDELLTVKAGYYEDAVVDVNQIEAISKLPSREELVGMLLSVWTAPLRNMAYVLNAPMANFATALDNLRAKKEQE